MIDFALLDPVVKAAADALRLDGCTVEPLFALNEAAPHIVAAYNGRVFLIRVPSLEDSEVVGLEDSPPENDWDAGWKGAVIEADDIQQVVASILSTPSPESAVPPVNLNRPSGLYAASALAFTTGLAGVLQPGIWNTSEQAVRATYGGTQYTSLEFWFQWNGDSPAASGTTRNVGISLREQNTTNAIEILWEVAPSNIGIKVQRRIAGVVTAETAAASNVPVIFPGGKWQKMRVDLVGSTLTVRVNDSNPIAWQGTLSGTALALAGPPGVITTNGAVNFVLWAPLPPAPTATIIQMDISPQANRPSQSITASGDSTDNPTYENIIASGKTDRIRLATVAGFSTLALRFKPEPGDVYSSGCRAGLKAPVSQPTVVNNRKCFQAFDGDRTRWTCQFQVPVGFPLQANMWRLGLQWHQDQSQPGPAPRSGSSPPIAVNFKQHKYSGVYWIWLEYDPNLWNASNQGYETFQLANGTWPLGGSVLWNEILQIGHPYTLVLDVTHGSLGPSETETATKKRGRISLAVDGVAKVTDYFGVNMYGLWNFPDGTLYMHPSSAASASDFVGGGLYEVIPGPNNPLLPFYTPP